MRWIGLFSKDGKLLLILYQISENNKIQFITYPNSYQITLPLSQKNYDIASALEIFLLIEEILQKNFEVIKNIRDIADKSDMEVYDSYENKLDYLTKVISETPLSPQKYKV